MSKDLNRVTAEEQIVMVSPVIFVKVLSFIGLKTMVRTITKKYKDFPPESY